MDGRDEESTLREAAETEIAQAAVERLAEGLEGERTLRAEALSALDRRLEEAAQLRERESEAARASRAEVRRLAEDVAAERASRGVGIAAVEQRLEEISEVVSGVERRVGEASRGVDDLCSLRDDISAVLRHTAQCVDEARRGVLEAGAGGEGIP